VKKFSTFFERKLTKVVHIMLKFSRCVGNFSLTSEIPSWGEEERDARSS